jgi:hypothetical protein
MNTSSKTARDRVTTLAVDPKDVGAAVASFLLDEYMASVLDDERARLQAFMKRGELSDDDAVAEQTIVLAGLVATLYARRVGVADVRPAARRVRIWLRRLGAAGRRSVTMQQLVERVLGVQRTEAQG